MVVHNFNLSIQQTEAGISLLIGGQPGLHNEFQASQGLDGVIRSLVITSTKTQAKSHISNHFHNLFLETGSCASQTSLELTVKDDLALVPKC